MPFLPLILASVLQNKGRVLVSILAIALGVALGYAVQAINAAAVNEFSQALQAVSGEADLIVRGPRAGFDEKLYPTLARMPEVAVASPMLEVEAHIVGRDEPLRVLGLDVFRAFRLQPSADRRRRRPTRHIATRHDLSVGTGCALAGARGGR